MGDPRAWFELNEPEERLTDVQKHLLASARRRLARLSPPRVLAEDSWGAVLPGMNSQGEDTWPANLCLCLPLSGVRHASLQLWLDVEGTLVGAWQDERYAWDDDPDWDDPSEEAFRAPTQPSPERVVREALDWLEEQMRRPYERLQWTIAGLVVWTDLAHTDGRAGWGTYDADSPPLVQRLGARLTKRMPAGYFDPWPD